MEKKTMIYEYMLSTEQEIHVLSMPSDAEIMGAQPCLGNNLNIFVWAVAANDDLKNRTFHFFRAYVDIPEGRFQYISTVQIPAHCAIHIFELLP